MRPLTDPDRGPPSNDPPDPKAVTPPRTGGLDLRPATFAEQGRPLPILYGTAKIPFTLLEKLTPATSIPALRSPSTTYKSGSYASINARIAFPRVSGSPLSGATTQQCVFLCTTTGATSAASDFSNPDGGGTNPTGDGSGYLHVGQTGIVDGACVWTLVSSDSAFGPIVQQFLAALCEGEAKGALRLWWDKEVTNAISLTDAGRNITVALGPDALGQAAPGVFDASGYQHTAIAYATQAWTGTKIELPAIALEIQGALFGLSGNDASPADILYDLITHTRRGCGLPTSRVDSTTVTGAGAASYRTYCDAVGFRLSWLIDTQRTALALIQDLLSATNSDAVWSGGALKVIPLGDQSITSPVYGAVNYVPSTTAAYNLGPDDFLDVTEPVQVTRRSDADCFNAWPVEYVDRGAVYSAVTVEDVDMLDADTRGLRRAPTVRIPQIFPDGTYPTMLARILAQRSTQVRNTYTFRVGWRYCRLEPTDIVTLTEPGIGLSLTPVRIVEWAENEDGTMTIVAEDYPAGVAAAKAYTPQAGDGYQANEKATTASAIPVSGGGQLPAPGVVGANALAIQNVSASALSNANTLNLWPNPSSENEPPAGADTSLPTYGGGTNGLGLISGSPEWCARVFTAAAWPAATHVTAGDACTNGGNGYICITTGTTAGAGGPTGTGSNITDGTAHWKYVSSSVQVVAGYSGYWSRYVPPVVGQIKLIIPATDGESYRLSAQSLRLSGAGFGQFGILFVDAYLNSLASAAGFSSGSGSWNQIVVTTSPAPLGTVAAIITLDATSSGGHLFDAISVRQMTEVDKLAVGVLPVANGGTGSATQNFVDLTTTQASIAGAKTFTTANPGGFAQEAWIAVSGGIGFQNSWVNFGAPYFGAAYFKDSLGVIHLRGRIKSGTINTAAFTLPAGYRPSATVLVPAIDGAGAAQLLGVDSSGNVIPVAGNNGAFTLDGVTFDTR